MATQEQRNPTGADQTRSPDPDLLARDRRLAEIVRRLLDAYQPERIYLFGSVARGEAGPDSDYDLLVVVPDDAPPERRDSALAYRVLREQVSPPMFWCAPIHTSRRGATSRHPCQGRSFGKGGSCMPHDPRLWLTRGLGLPRP